MTFLRIFARAFATTLWLFLGAAIPWVIVAALFPIQWPTTLQLAALWFVVFGMALTVETLMTDFDRGRGG